MISNARRSEGTNQLNIRFYSDEHGISQVFLNMAHSNDYLIRIQIRYSLESESLASEREENNIFSE